MPPAPDMNDQSISVEIAVPNDAPVERAADPVIKPSPEKRPWYRRPRILYAIATVVALISLGLAVFAILWATGTIDTTSSGATVSSGTDGSNQDTTPAATEAPVNINSPPPPPPQDSPQPPPEETAQPPPTDQSTPVQSPLPTASPTATQTTRTDPLSFYVMGDVPYAQWEEIMLGTQMGTMTSNLAPGATFVVHVGDMQKSQRTNCELSYFYRIANILLQGPLPTFVQVGDNDYLDCPDKTAAFDNYLNTFVGFEGNWTHSLNVDRWTTLEPVPMEYDIARMASNPEMFAFLEDGILFMGYTLLNMNLDQGEQPDQLFYERLEDSKAWVRKQLTEKQQQGRIRGVVMFSHAMVSPDIRPFFEDLKDMFTNAGVYAPVLYIHGDGHDFKINTELGSNLGWPQLTRVEVDQGAYADPLLITVAPDLGGIVQNLVADNSGLQFVVGNGMFLIDRQNGRYPDSVNPNNR